MLRILFDTVLDFSFCCQEKFLESGWIFIVSFFQTVSMDLNGKNIEDEIQQHHKPDSIGGVLCAPPSASFKINAFSW